jgi:hypothetical protein
VSYTIQSAQYANAESTAVVLQTTESGAVLASTERPDVWASYQSWVIAGGVTAAYDAPTEAEIAQGLRDVANGIFQTGTGADAKLYRSIAAVLLDENNALRQWITSFKAATAASSSLADFKTRVAALPAMPDRTLAQAKTAVTNKLNGGTVD